MISKKEILIKFGERVREIRKEKGLSQEELSFKADLHRTYIGMIERAEKNITLLNIEKIAKAFEIKVLETELHGHTIKQWSKLIGDSKTNTIDLIKDLI